MSLYVVNTNVCRENAERHCQELFIHNISESIRTTQNLIGFALFLPTPFIKRNLGRSFRLIGYRAPVGEDELILFLRVFARGSNEYTYFLDNCSENTELLINRLMPYTEAELINIHRELAVTQPAPLLPSPSDEERCWLYEVFREENADEGLLVLETEEWVKKIRNSENRDYLALYHQMIEQIDWKLLNMASTNLDCHVHWEDNMRLGFLYLYRPDLDRLVLLEPLRHYDDVNVLRDKHLARLGKTGEGRHDLSRISVRSYPFFMVLDQDAWLAIQNDEEANLALSPEEAKLLESIHRAGAEGELGYPLFINGRAGSGKSTMLQYLVADYVEYALRRETINPTLFMTCSPDLLERARETVRGLLTAHHVRLLNKPYLQHTLNDILNKSFWVFKDFLLELLPPEMKDSFPESKYVNYAEFRRLWAKEFRKRPEARRLSPDVSWHAIRSYIKGIRSTRNDELEPQEFNALPRRRRSISEHTYKNIYENVWIRWYKRLCEDEGAWDDQDLAASVLEAGLARRINSAAIFCDEAQDFTPLELDIIFQLSLFSRRSMQPEELRRVPIVFAGDPLQTINPTGFRWDTVKADFHERFCAVLDPRRRAKVELSYCELRFNYRSNPGIVGFCNLIQLVRSCLLDISDIHPQEAW
jgi:hypothetical protein